MNNYKKLLQQLLYSNSEAGFMDQFMNEGFMEIVKTDAELIEYVLSNAKMNSKRWVELVDTRRKLLDINPLDYSFELDLHIKAFPKNKEYTQELFNEGFGLPKFLNKFYQLSQVLYLKDLEGLMLKEGDKVFDYNKDRIINVLELLKKNKEFLTYLESFGSVELLTKKWFIDWSVNNGTLSLENRVYNKMDYDYDFAINLVKKNPENYIHLKNEYKEDKEIIAIILDNLEMYKDKLFNFDGSNVLSLGLNQRLQKEVSNILEKLDNVEDLVNRAANVGIYVSRKSTDENILLLTEVKWDSYIQNKENINRKDILGSKNADGFKVHIFNQNLSTEEWAVKLIESKLLFLRFAEMLEKELDLINPTQRFSEDMKGVFSCLTIAAKKHKALKEIFKDNADDLDYYSFTKEELRKLTPERVRVPLTTIIMTLNKELMVNEMEKKGLKPTTNKVLKF